MTIRVEVDDTAGIARLCCGETEGPEVGFGEIATLNHDGHLYYCHIPEDGWPSEDDEDAPPPQLRVFRVDRLKGEKIGVDDWDVVTGREEFELRSPDGECSAGTPYGEYAAVMHEDGVYVVKCDSRRDEPDEVMHVAAVTEADAMTEWVEFPDEEETEDDGDDDDAIFPDDDEDDDESGEPDEDEDE